MLGEGGLLTAIHKGLHAEILKVVSDLDFIIVHCKILDEEYLLVNVYITCHNSSPWILLQVLKNFGVRLQSLMCLK